MPKKGLTKTEIKKFKDMLQDKKRDLLQKLMKDSDRYHEIFKSSQEGDLADIANDTYEKYLIYDISLNEKEELKDIEDALMKVENETYGICQDCDAFISKQRLQVKPYAKLCISCREKLESKQR